MMMLRVVHVIRQRRPFTTKVQKSSLLLRNRYTEWVTSFNDSLSKYPKTAMTVFLSSRTLTWYLLVFLLNVKLIPLHFGAEWAIGYLGMRVSGKFRHPATLLLASGIHKAFPSLSNIKASALMGAVNFDDPKEKPSPAMEKVKEWINGPLDKYGFAYYLASKATIGMSIGIITGCAMYGWDMQSQLSAWGVPVTMQEGAGSMAGATLLNLVLLPLHLYGLPQAMHACRTHLPLFQEPNAQQR